MRLTLLVALAACGPRITVDPHTDPTGASGCTVNGTPELVVDSAAFQTGNAALGVFYRESFVFFGNEIAYVDIEAGNPFGFGGKSGAIIAAPKVPGAKRTLYTPPTNQAIIGMNGDGTRVFVAETMSIDSDNSSVAIVQVESGSRVAYATAPSGTKWDLFTTRILAADTSGVYVQTRSTTIPGGVDSNVIVRIPSAGAAPVVIGTFPQILGAAQKAGDDIYVVDKQNLGALYKVAANATGPSSQTQLLAEANCRAGWFDPAGLFCPRVLKVTRLGLDGMGGSDIRDDTQFSSAPGYHVGPVDAGKLYFGFSGTASKPWPIQRIPVAGGAPENVVCDRKLVMDIRPDATHYYWLEAPDSASKQSIYRLAR